MISHRVGGLAAAAGLSLMLVSGGLYASWSDSAQVQGSANVGSFACELTSDTVGAVVSPDRKSVTYTAPPIQSSVVADIGTLSVDITAAGTIPVRVHWTWVGSDAPGGHWSASMGTPSIVDDVTLAAGETKPYDGLGLAVSELDNTDLGTVHSVTYTANCAEVPPPPTNVSVPDVVGLPEADAVGALVGAGLALGVMTEAFSNAPVGHIVSQSPAAGASVPPGTAVDCVKSKGVALVAVPDVIGDPLGDATAAITGAGLVMGTREPDEFHASIAANSIISTNPSAGALVAPGTAVGYTVSKGAPPPPVEYIGTATAASGAAAAYPAGTQAGDIVIAVTTRWAATSNSLIGGPAAGFTKIGSTLYTGSKACGPSLPSNCYQTSAAFYHVVGSETATGPWANTRGVRIVVYRHATVGAISSQVGSNYPALPLQVTDGSSWVAGLAVSNGGTTAGSISSGGGVTSWPATSGPSAGSHAFSIELKRN